MKRWLLVDDNRGRADVAFFCRCPSMSAKMSLVSNGCHSASAPTPGARYVRSKLRGKSPR